MRALICETPGILEYKELEIQRLPEKYTLLKIKRIGICGTDLHAFEGTQPFFSYPRILGHELAAEIVTTTAENGFKIGESVTITPYFYCGKCIACRSGKQNCCTSIQVSGVHIDGGMQEYLAVPDYSLIHGQGLTADQLALVEPLAIGAHGIRRAEVKPGEFVLVIGAGPIGLGTIEFARIAGATVIALDINQQRLEFCKEKLSIPYTINALDSTVAEQLAKITNGEMATAVIDCTGNLNAIQQGFLYMAHTARYVLVGLQKNPVSFSHPEFHKREATLMSSRNANPADFNYVISSIKKGLIEPNRYITHRVLFDNVKEEFSGWLDPASEVIKVMVHFPGNRPLE